MISKRTLDFKNAKSIDIVHTGHDKTRFTTTLTIAADGTRLPSYLIFKKLKKSPSVKTSSNIVMAVSKSGFMDQKLMII
jgi:hypothetical protein